MSMEKRYELEFYGKILWHKDTDIFAGRRIGVNSEQSGFA